MRTIASSSVSTSIEVTSARTVLDVRKGLSSDDAQRRLAEYGANEIRREEATSALILLARQFASPVIWLLLGASAVISLLIRSAIPGNMVEPPLRTMFPYRSFLISTSHFMMEL